MSFVQLDFYSKTLGFDCQLNVVLPEEKQGVGFIPVPRSGKHPVLYLLHSYTYISPGKHGRVVYSVAHKGNSSAVISTVQYFFKLCYLIFGHKLAEDLIHSQIGRHLIRHLAGISRKHDRLFHAGFMKL